jgi:uncharacterized membrane protein
MAGLTQHADADKARPLRVLGFDSSDLRALGTMALGAIVIIPTTAYLFGGLRFGPHDWTPGFNLERLRHAGPVVAAHIVAALIALATGLFVLSRRKGAFGHRVVGRAWAALMLGTAITGMAIEPHRFSPAHGAALLVFVMVPLAIRKVRRGDLRGHRRAMAQLLIALVIVGLLAFLPGQLLHSVFFAGS